MSAPPQPATGITARTVNYAVWILALIVVLAWHGTSLGDALSEPLPSPDPQACSTRPAITVTTLAPTPSGSGPVQVTVTVSSSANVPNNRLQQIRFGSGVNIFVKIDNSWIVGDYNLTMRAGTQSYTFTFTPQTHTQAVGDREKCRGLIVKSAERWGKVSRL
ncbi:MAG TPA: hypothetical protein VII06_00430 [Chloroflexota bacterium]|jgi:hypothetical protein